MSLTAYREKRRFEKTPEPRGGKTHRAEALRFVVQKHAASRLHYDFRLELDGTLKSWAVPKGPSLNPHDRRLAVMVEDHPIEYGGFEGIIPKGNYGAGTVMVWDAGTYHALEATDRAESERRLREGLAKGRLRFVVEGKRLRGGFSLVRLKDREGNGEYKNWLLIKSADEFANESDVTERDRSVLSRRSMEAIARVAPEVGAVWHSRSKEPAAWEALPRAAMPHKVKPMLATLVDAPFDRAGWLFEPKWDGYRAIAEVSGRGVRLYSRNQQPFEQRFAPLAHALESLPYDAVLDGEIVVVDSAGKPSFQLLQSYQKNGRGQLLYYVFDLLYLDGHDLRPLPLAKRKEWLSAVISGTGLVRVSEHVEERGRDFFAAAEKLELEGIIAKDGRSRYREGERGRSWLKIKTHQRQEAVIGGFTEPRGARAHMGALVLGVYEGDNLRYIGHTGGGFTDKELAAMRAKLAPLERPTSPFPDPPRTNAPVHWVEPWLVCEIAFREWTDSGSARHPIFLGLREDKPARQVRRERVEPAPEPSDSETSARTRRRVRSRARSADSRETESGRKAIDAPNGAPVLTNPDKLFWPAEGLTKRDLWEYYKEIAPAILPYLRDRPLSLNRHPSGIDGPSFFQKDMSGQSLPAWLKTIVIPSQSHGRKIAYALCQDEPSLLYLANLGCIELNPWSSRTVSLDKPDYLVIDLDPEAIEFARVIEAAQAVHRLLDKAGIASFCKTSGKTGLHIYVPLGTRYNYEQAKQFAEIVANLVHGALPATTSVVRDPAQRQGRIYLDFLQNRRGQTLAAPYSVRPVPGACVSTPLRWSEVRASLDPSRFTMRTTRKRFDKLGDLWAPVLNEELDMEAALERLLRRARPKA